MPPGTPYNGIIQEYPFIRVDEFTTLQEPAKLHLLTHAHSDHLVGLQAKSFDGQIICSEDTKDVLLRLEQYKERAYYADEIRAQKKRVYAHLKIDPIVKEDRRTIYDGSRDLLVRGCSPLFASFLMLSIEGHPVKYPYTYCCCRERVGDINAH